MASVAEVNLRERVASAVEAALSAFARLHDRPLTLLPLSNGELAALDAEIDGDAQVGPRQQVRTLVRKAAGRPIMLVAGAGPLKTYTMARMARDAYDLSLCMAAFIVRELEHLPEVLEAARLEKRLVAANNLGRLGFRVLDERGSRFSGKVEVRKGPIKGSYRMDVLLPPRFPDTQPFFRLVEVPRHPNVYDSGDVCLGHFVWNPALDITVLVEQVRHVLENPNYEDGLHRADDEIEEPDRTALTALADEDVPREEPDPEIMARYRLALTVIAELSGNDESAVPYNEFREVLTEREGWDGATFETVFRGLMNGGQIYLPDGGHIRRTDVPREEPDREMVRRFGLALTVIAELSGNEAGAASYVDIRRELEARGGWDGATIDTVIRGLLSSGEIFEPDRDHIRRL